MKDTLLQNALDVHLSKEVKDCPAGAVLMVEIIQKKNIVGYWGDEFDNFLKITVRLPNFVGIARRLLKKISLPPDPLHEFECFETNIDFEIRCVDDSSRMVFCNSTYLVHNALLFLQIHGRY